MRLPFTGVLEKPLPSAEPVIGERLHVQGWALTDGGLDGVSARFGSGGAASELSVGQRRADVASAYPRHPGAARAGFAGWISIDSLAPGEHVLTVTVHANGSAVHAWQRTVCIVDMTAAYNDWRLRALAALASDGPTARTDAAAPSADADSLIGWVVWRTAESSDADLHATLATIGAHRRQTDAIRVLPDHRDSTAGPSLPITPYVGFLVAGDRLAPGAIAALSGRLRDHPEIDLLYGDHDMADARGLCQEPVLKPAWSPLLHRHPDVRRSGCVVRCTLLPAEAPDCSPQASEPGLPLESGRRCKTVEHLPLPLLSVRYGHKHTPVPNSLTLPSWPTVSVVIPTCVADRAMLARCLDGLRHDTDYLALEIVVVLNNLTDTTVAAMQDFLRPWDVVVRHLGGPFNWSALNNAGAGVANGDYLLFLNDDVEPLQRPWLKAMVAVAQKPEVGAVGAVLRYADGTVQHAGVYINNRDRVDCRHSFQHCTGREPRVARWLLHDRVQTAVTGACLLTPRRHYLEVGGFDEGLPVVFNDLDYCLRLRRLGAHSVVAAGAALTHHESFSRFDISEGSDYGFFVERWASSLPRTDPFSHPNLAANRDDWMFDPSVNAGHVAARRWLAAD